MEPLLIKCPLCGQTHTYTIKQQSIAIRNAAFKTTVPSLSRLFGAQRRSPTRPTSVAVFAHCPEKDQRFTVTLNPDYLTSHSLDASKICLALVGQSGSNN
jgi:hypothetical protein